MNKILLTGRITKDPQLVSYNNGESGFCNFAIAVTRPNTKNEITDFFSCIAWKEKANYITKYIHKGDLIAITGVLQTRTYEDKNTQEKRVMTEIYVEQVELCISSGNKQNKPQQDSSFGTETPVYEPNW